MNEMLEAAKFYRECIQDVQKSIMMEIESKPNSLVDFSAKVFKNLGHRSINIHITFVLNDETCNLISIVPDRSSQAQLISFVQKDIAAKIADKITIKILSELE